jgi:hypothetical protein
MPLMEFCDTLYILPYSIEDGDSVLAHFCSNACARPRLQYGTPLSQGSAMLWHGAIGLPTLLPGRGYGRTDAVRRAASAAWSRATFFVLACQATSKRSPTTGSAPTTDSRAMLAAIRRSTPRGAPRRMAS